MNHEDGWQIKSFFSLWAAPSLIIFGSSKAIWGSVTINQRIADGPYREGERQGHKVTVKNYNCSRHLAKKVKSTFFKKKIWWWLHEHCRDYNAENKELSGWSNKSKVYCKCFHRQLKKTIDHLVVYGVITFYRHWRVFIVPRFRLLQLHRKPSTISAKHVSNSLAKYNHPRPKVRSHMISHTNLFESNSARRTYSFYAISYSVQFQFQLVFFGSLPRWQLVCVCVCEKQVH